jgi:hypothetical protein
LQSCIGSRAQALKFKFKIEFILKFENTLTGRGGSGRRLRTCGNNASERGRQRWHGRGAQDGRRQAEIEGGKKPDSRQDGEWRGDARKIACGTEQGISPIDPSGGVCAGSLVRTKSASPSKIASSTPSPEYTTIVTQTNAISTKRNQSRHVPAPADIEVNVIEVNFLATRGRRSASSIRHLVMTQYLRT